MSRFSHLLSGVALASLRQVWLKTGGKGQPINHIRGLGLPTFVQTLLTSAVHCYLFSVCKGQPSVLSLLARDSLQCYHHGEKRCGIWEAPSQEMLPFGEKF